MQRVTEDFTPAQIFNNRITMDVNIAKAVDSIMPVVIASHNTMGAKAFVKLTEECLQKLEASTALYQATQTKMNLSNLD